MAVSTDDTTLPASMPSEQVTSATSSVHEGSNDPPAFKPSAQFWLAFLVLAVLTLMVALDGTSISVALGIISKRLHGDALEAFWAGTSFLLCSTVFQPSFASLSHIFGRRPLVLAAITFFFIGVLIASLAQNFTLLLAGRSIQGIGGGGIIAMTEIIVTDLTPLRYRGQYAGIIGGMWAIGSVSGPVIGGAFAQVNWRWILYINFPFIVMGYVMVPLFLKLNFVSSSMLSKLRRVDWAGTVLFVGGSTSFLIPLTWGGVMYSWTSWRTLVPLIVGAITLVVFVFYEKYVAAEPVVRLSIFANRTVNLAFLTTVLHGLILWCLLYYQPLYFEAVQGYSPIISGVALFPATFTVAPMSIVTGIMVTKTGRYRWAIWLGWILTCFGTGLMVLLKVDTTIPQWMFITLVSGVGLGILFPGLQIVVQASSSNKDMAFAVALFSFFRAFGQALGVALGGTIFQNSMVKNLQAYPQFATQATSLAQDAAALVQIIKATPDGPDKLALRTAYTDSLHTIYIFMCIVAGVSLVLSLFIKSYNINVEHETEQGLIVREKAQEAALEEGKGDVV